jgi:hypothetical protein
MSTEGKKAGVALLDSVVGQRGIPPANVLGHGGESHHMDMKSW